MPYIYVLTPDGRPLMPTTRQRHVKHLLDAGKARIAHHAPFTIQLKYNTPEIVQPVMAGVDPGRTNLGISAIDATGNLLFSAVCETRNKEIRKLMDERRTHRRASRSGERKARQRLAKKYNTMMAAGMKMRQLPCYGDDKVIECHGIKNTQARFCNRRRTEGWLTPTVEQLVRTHINLVRKAGKYLPITDVTLEVNRFAFALMDNPNIAGLGFQNGPLKGFDSVEDAVCDEQHGRCLLCEAKKIVHYHHLVPRSKGGSNTLENIAGLCEECHDMVHTDEAKKVELAEKKKGLLKKYGALSALNQAIPFIAKRLTEEYGSDHISFTTGRETAVMRDSLGFNAKDHETNPCHEIDAYCIALLGMNAVPAVTPRFTNVYQIRQFRRHDRQLVKAQRERTYKLDGVIVAKNRKPRFEQKGEALSQWYERMVREHGRQKANTMRSKLEVVPSKRSYNSKERLMPGAVFRFHGIKYIMTGQLTGGKYYRAEGQGSVNFPAKKCRIEKRNEGLVIVSGRQDARIS